MLEEASRRRGSRIDCENVKAESGNLAQFLKQRTPQSLASSLLHDVHSPNASSPFQGWVWLFVEASYSHCEVSVQEDEQTFARLRESVVARLEIIDEPTNRPISLRRGFSNDRVPITSTKRGYPNWFDVPSSMT